MSFEGMTKHILRTFAFETWDMRTNWLEAHFGDKLYKAVALSNLINLGNPCSCNGLSSNARHTKEKNWEGSIFPYFKLLGKCRRIPLVNLCNFHCSWPVYQLDLLQTLKSSCPQPILGVICLKSLKSTEKLLKRRFFCLIRSTFSGHLPL